MHRLRIRWAWRRLRRLLPGYRAPHPPPLVLWVLTAEQFGLLRPHLEALARRWGAGGQRWLILQNEARSKPPPSSFERYVLPPQQRCWDGGLGDEALRWLEASASRWGICLEPSVSPAAAEALLRSGALWRVALSTPALEEVVDLVWQIREDDPEHVTRQMARYADWVRGFGGVGSA
ncbi:MAG: hypothetical protein N2561_02915 [Bacteroidetes bacterium]|nr:hypothetical protein [Rhodothermia bacterium]MCS7155612.1 hypothetical protein [Bacteroidota bacterium]MCX7906470.1 hypothetical protein [Bacteroidota bacterium]MDW8137248.1 hypothetical protein [Bacteroidota bacterium]MDW8284882.1 hypothetical protein [Bacteroidota bacterium]